MPTYMPQRIPCHFVEIPNGHINGHIFCSSTDDWGAPDYHFVSCERCGEDLNDDDPEDCPPCSGTFNDGDYE